MATEFPAAVTAAAARGSWSRAGRSDLTAIEFVTIDPPDSMDLDQAMHLERNGGGYRVRYAIADVSALVGRGGPVEAEAWRRGVTVYCPDARALLYPRELSEGRASLLPDEERPAVVFTIELDGRGKRTAARVERAVVRSRHKLAYATAHVPLLEQVGRLRAQLARQRGSVQLNAPAQTVVSDPSQACGYRLELERRVASEDWNAEISLLAGMAAAAMMAERGLGLLRTMPGVDGYRLERLRRAAAALHMPWPRGTDYDDFVTGLDPAEPHQASLLQEARGVMGHAGYEFFRGAVPAGAVHAGIAALYAHCTAPLRRLADRYVLDLLVGDGDAAALSRLPEVMGDAESRAARVERAVVDDMEARALEHRVGETFEAVALDRDARGTIIQIAEPPIRARLHADPPPALGETARVLLTRADPRSRSLEFRLAGEVARGG